MISSSEVGGCCRVQVACPFPSIALSGCSLLLLFIFLLSLPAAILRVSPLARLESAFSLPPSSTLRLSFSSTPFVLSRPFYQKFRPHC